MPPPITLEQQADKLERMAAERIAHYRRAVEKGTRPLEWAAGKQAEVEAIRRSFAFLVANQDWIRAEAQRRAERARREAEMADAAIDDHTGEAGDSRQSPASLLDEIEQLKNEPAVAAALAAFPGAQIDDVREIA